VDPVAVEILMSHLLGIEDPLLRLQSIVHLVKVNKQAILPDFAEFLNTNREP